MAKSTKQTPPAKESPVVQTSIDPAVAAASAPPEVVAAVNPEVAASAARNMGGQVMPATQLREDDGNRTLAQPVTDPGPVIIDGDGNPVEGMYAATPADAATPVMTANVKRFAPETVVQRVGTKPHDDAELAEVDMGPDMVIGQGASDMYHKEGRNNDGRNPVAENAAKPRVVPEYRE